MSRSQSQLSISKPIQSIGTGTWFAQIGCTVP